MGGRGADAGVGGVDRDGDGDDGNGTISCWCWGSIVGVVVEGVVFVMLPAVVASISCTP